MRKIAYNTIVGREKSVVKNIYTIVLAPAESGYIVRVPDVPGCTTGGPTIQEAVRMARDALCGCLCAYEDEGIELPEPRLPHEIAAEQGEELVLLDVDTDTYRAEMDMDEALGRRIAAISEVDPDEEDRRMLSEAARENDEMLVDYDEFIQKIE